VFARILRLLAVLCLLLAGACSPKAEAICSGDDVRLTTTGKLTVAADYSYPPFAFRDPDNNLVGFDVDVAKAVAKDMKLEPAFVNRGTGALVTGLIAHRHDLAASGLRLSETLEDEACPSAPYLDASFGVLVWETNPFEIDAVKDLDGRTVAVLDGSDAEDWAIAHLKSSTLASLPATDDLLTSLQQGRADAVVADLPFVRFSARQSPAFAFVANISTDQSYVLVGAEDNGPLVLGVNHSLERLRKNGTLERLETKWFGEPEPSPSSS
jgi:ABC-type amino acid transport substrate-binding protein